MYDYEYFRQYSIFRSIAFLPVAVSSLAIAAAAFILFRATTSRQKNYPPLIPAGMIETTLAISGNDCPWFFLRMAQAVQSHVFRLPIPTMFGKAPMVAAVGEPQTAVDILKDPLTTKPAMIYGIFDGVTNGERGLFTSNGEYWHKRRKGVTPAFSSNHVKRMNTVALEEVDKWIQNTLLPVVERGEAFDAGDEIIDIVLSSICQTAFEYEMSEEAKKMLLEELDIVLIEFVQKSLVNPMRKFFGLLLPERRRAHLAAQRLADLCVRIIDAHRNEKDPIQGTVIERIVSNEAYENDNQRAADVLAFLIAGHDTTAYSIAWILKELAKNPTEQDKLRENLRKLAPEEWNKSNSLTMVVKEGMRLHPVAAATVVRAVGRDFESKRGYLLPKDSICFIPIFMVHRNSDVFENADSFVPSRWENPTQDMNDAFMPFVSGKQNCLGQSLANAELLSILPRIIVDFHLDIEEEGRTNFFLTLKPVGLKLKARKI